MIKYVVINVNYERSPRFRFELPETEATMKFNRYFLEHSNTKVNRGRYWLIYYNARNELLEAVKKSGQSELLAKLMAFDNDPLAIGIMLDLVINKDHIAWSD
ncbi:hypothetical protein LAA31_002494 [Salmonella enterica subsp. enterica serovar Enteritidis]|uniref:hypothetical protein n=1 Tax=Enterobacteriaceae TaxID=543 RepID=UPI0012D0310A|nr:hypothetical protein [Enterobacter ludwigii]EBU9744768.1 hypothetical protein [Salmonella enterica subsp. enterica serovar Kentucky]EBV0299495.1 hypothetical protein [Salmonella enterica subsp. enterica serovar Enteritidis]EIC3584670.1 hypothetical protein [Salmonella enterica subsp. enterica serovar Enteritidis]WNI83791.1 hypothetical protein RIK68_24380 [Enterobacter ludwigii]